MPRHLSLTCQRRSDDALHLGLPNPVRAAYAIDDAGSSSWQDSGVVSDNPINNFPPKRLPSGEWMMSRRTHNYKEIGVHFLVGGLTTLNTWESFPVLGSNQGLSAEEPYWWVLPDGNLMAMFRDNQRSGYLFRSFSTDNGRTWNQPVRTNFPDARSKFHGLRMSDGRYVLVSNVNPGLLRSSALKNKGISCPTLTVDCHSMLWRGTPRNGSIPSVLSG